MVTTVVKNIFKPAKFYPLKPWKEIKYRIMQYNWSSLLAKRALVENVTFPQNLAAPFNPVFMPARLPKLVTISSSHPFTFAVNGWPSALQWLQREEGRTAKKSTTVQTWETLAIGTTSQFDVFLEYIINPAENT